MLKLSLRRYKTAFQKHFPLPSHFYFIVKPRNYLFSRASLALYGCTSSSVRFGSTEYSFQYLKCSVVTICSINFSGLQYIIKKQELLGHLLHVIRGISIHYTYIDIQTCNRKALLNLSGQFEPLICGMLPLGNTVAVFFENGIGHKKRCHHIITGWINSATDSENKHTHATNCFTDLNSLFDTRLLI